MRSRSSLFNGYDSRYVKKNLRKSSRTPKVGAPARAAGSAA